MPPRKQKPAVVTADDDADLDAMLDAAIRENQAVAGSPAALRLEQEQRESRERLEEEQREARERVQAEAEALYVCGGCGAGQARQRCGGCATVRYCGEHCQVAHWPAHEARCRVLKTEAAVAAAEAEVEAVRREREEQEEEEQEVVQHNPDTEAGNCWTCGADNPRNLCNRCKVTKYCGVACQTENWSIHKGMCAHLKAKAAGFNQVKSQLRKVKGGARRSQEQLDGDLTNASLLGRIIDIERVIAAGGNVSASNRMGFLPLIGAAQEGHARAIGVLMRHGALVDVRNEDGQTACHIAANFGHLKAVAALLEHGAQIDSRDNNGGSSLFRASQMNHPEVVALLLMEGAQVDLPANERWTPLLVSAHQGHVAVARLLLERGAHIDSTTNEGFSALYVASQNNHPEVVALLLQKGAQVDLEEKKGGTPLLISAQKGHAACVRLLLQAGADPLHRANDGGTPFSPPPNYPEVAALLRARIAEIVRERRALQMPMPTLSPEP